MGEGAIKEREQHDGRDRACYPCQNVDLLARLQCSSGLDDIRLGNRRLAIGHKMLSRRGGGLGTQRLFMDIICRVKRWRADYAQKKPRRSGVLKVWERMPERRVLITGALPMPQVRN